MTQVETPVATIEVCQKWEIQDFTSLFFQFSSLDKTPNRQTIHI